ncbi:hypothetical protein QM012_007547 [Aureobasidium pullulans]|uniref:Uncharacterized protein n=1 Tax=Aureobasidium pullulans TaxID=5580 RepID=A0ABR0TPN9_AURPU
MAAQLSLSSDPDIPQLSSKIAFHDLARLIPSQSWTLRKGLLFMSTPLNLATQEDREYLRDELKIRTIISTLHPKEPRYTGGTTADSYIIEQYAVEDFLGLKTFHIHLRLGDEFVRHTINELPLWSRLKFKYYAATASDLKDLDLLRKTHDLVWNHDSIDNSFAVLTTAAPLIGRLFNDAFCEAKSYPLIISGNFMLDDNGLLMFLLLLLLEIPISALEHAYMCLAEDFFSKGKEAGVKETPIIQAWATNYRHWVRELLSRLETRYGSIAVYFDSAGVNKATREKIKDVLLDSEERQLIHTK